MLALRNFLASIGGRKFLVISGYTAVVLLGALLLDWTTHPATAYLDAAKIAGNVVMVYLGAQAVQNSVEKFKK